MTKRLYLVTADTLVCGAFVATDEQDARDQAAQDAGYDDEADMTKQIEQPSRLTATLLTAEEEALANAAAASWPVYAERIHPTATYEQWASTTFSQLRDEAAQTIVACR